MLDEKYSYNYFRDRWVHRKGEPTFWELVGQDMFWRTRDGEVLHVGDMEISHCRNLMAYLVRAWPREKLGIQMRLVRYSLLLQGEMALIANERAQEDIGRIDVRHSPLYRQLAARVQRELREGFSLDV